MSDLNSLAELLGADEATLRRCLRIGMVRANRPSARKLDVSASEKLYLFHNWLLLSGLRRALRTEPSVGMAVVFGSVARGDHRNDSDLDLLISLRHDTPWISSLALRLSDAVGREVEIVRLPQAERDASLLSQILKEGRVLIDRDDEWNDLVRNQKVIEKRGQEERAERRRATRQALEFFN